MIRNTFILAMAMGLAACGTPVARLELAGLESGVTLRGVNLAGAEFGEQSISADAVGRHGKDYIYPAPGFAGGYQTPANLVETGFNTFRLPFRWERLQPELGGPFDGAELGRLSRTVKYLNGLGAFVIIDPHNYARYRGEVIGEGVTAEDFGDFWRRLAAAFKDADGVVFGLMNEPNNMRTEDWVEAANAAIAAIREVEAPNLILVPGNHWSGAHAWNGNSYGTPNARALLAISDPLDFTAFEAHQYVDADSSGSSPECVEPRTAARRLAPFTNWLQRHGKAGFLGEFGGGPSEACLAAVDAMLRHVERNNDVYIGWTAWAAGPWWPESYHLSLEPNAAGRGQLDVLESYLSGFNGILPSQNLAF